MTGSTEHNDAVVIVTVQLVISLLVMPITPMLWICGAGHMTSTVQRLSRTSPVVWSIFFSIMMPGPMTFYSTVLRHALVPADWYNLAVRTLIGALLVLMVAPGSYFLARFFRWGTRPEPPHPTLSRSAPAEESAALAENKKTGANSDKESALKRHSYLTTKYRFIHFLYSGLQWALYVLDFFFPVIESIGVEVAWRVYLLSRLLFALGPEAALISMAILSTLSDLPSVLYVVCSDTPIIIQYASRDDPEDRRLFYRDAPPASTTILYTLHTVLFNCVLGMLVLMSNFCVWPSVLLSLYWSHVSKIVSGRMLVSTYLPVGMEALAMSRLSHEQDKFIIKSWIRGPAWKVSCEGLAGILVALPVAVATYHYAGGVSEWREAVKGVLPPHTLL
ncbi:uncharacterized protein LOC135825679 [Sycon ciliatum]|uniref:uncharacterized protein LOC135825679 n=1 Tax=Sycon ciliatum TaxID=27933 RepID=UPI0031F6ADF0